MSDYRVVPVDNMKYQAVGSPTAGTVSSTTAAQPQLQGTPVQGTEGSTPAAPQPAKPAPVEAEKSKDSLPITNQSDVSLKFQIDEDTHNITVFIIDRESNRVLRSIPPQELNKLKAGDLLQMLA